MPRITKEDKARNRDNIVAAAGRMFRSQGIDSVGIADLMKAAGLTHGGFYNHFPSKDALAVEVCNSAFAASHAAMNQLIEQGTDESGTPMTKIVQEYLSTGHRDSPEAGCPSAALVGDAWRQGEEIQSAYAAGVQGYLCGFAAEIRLEAAARGEELPETEVRDQAVRLLSEMVGAMVLARAVHQANPTLSDEILESSRRNLFSDPAAERTG